MKIPIPCLFRFFLQLTLTALFAIFLILPQSAQAAADPRPRKGGLKIEVSEKGVYRITGSDMAAAGIDPSAIDPATFRLFHRDAEIRITVASASDGKFDPEDVIRFYATGIDNQYTGMDVYWLYWSTAVSGRRELSADGTPVAASPLVATTRETLKVEENHAIWSDTPGAPENDYWFWERLTAPQSIRLTFDAPHLTGDGDAVLSVYFQGRSEGDHHTVLQCNDRTIGDESWPGAAIHAQSATIAQSDLKAVSNAVTVTSSGVSGDVLYLNRLELNYLKNLTAKNNALIFTISQTDPARVAVSGFSSETITILDITDPVNVVQVSGIDIAPVGTAFRAIFQHGGGEKTYAALSVGALKTPDRMVFTNWPSLKNTDNGADYILISGRDLLPSLEKLCELRRRQGLRVKTAAMEDIYDVFSFGFFDPAAVRDFLKYTAESWQKPAPAYVLLAGDANLDYRNYFETKKQNIVPVHLSTTLELGLTPSDNWYVGFENGPEPVMNIGRIPGADADDLTNVAAKVIRYETTESNIAGRVILAADDDDTAFEDLCDLLATYLPRDVSAETIYTRLYPDMDAASSAILGAVNRGALLTGFVGHGDVTRWGAEPAGGGDFIIEPRDLAALTNKTRLTCVMALNCLNGYFSQSYNYCLAEDWVMAKDRGAVACIAPSGLSHPWEHEFFSTAFFNNLFGGRENRIGELFTQSKRDAYYMGASDKALISLNLIGDPATRLAVYRNPSDMVTAYWITAAAGTGGQISPSGDIPVFAGQTETFTIAPAEGYEVSGVTVDGVSQGPVAAYTFPAVSGNHAISASFKVRSSGGGGGGGGGCFIGALN